MNDADVDDLARVLAEHVPVIGATYLPGRGPRGHIVGCSCTDAREYRAAGFRAGWDGWCEHFAAVASGVVVSARDVKALADDTQDLGLLYTTKRLRSLLREPATDAAVKGTSKLDTNSDATDAATEETA